MKQFFLNLFTKLLFWKNQRPKAKIGVGNISIHPRVGKYRAIPSSREEAEALEKIGGLEFEALSVGTEDGQIAIIPLDESSRANAERIVYLLKFHDYLIKMLNQQIEYHKEERNRYIKLFVEGSKLFPKSKFGEHYRSHVKESNYRIQKKIDQVK